MTTLAAPRLLGRIRARTWSLLLTAWGAVTGLLPHVLHHVGPLAGAAVLAGAGGRLLFAAIALAASFPFLLRLHRRFKTLLAPMLALAAMATAFAVSTFLIAPLITGSGSTQKPGIQQPAGHAEHHQK